MPDPAVIDEVRALRSELAGLVHPAGAAAAGTRPAPLAELVGE